MKKIVSGVCAGIGLLALAGCVDPGGSGSGGSVSGGASPAEAACRSAVIRNNGGGSATVVSSDFSQAGTVVMLDDARQAGAWRCLASNDGVVQELSFQESSSQAAAGTPSREEQACLAAVSRETNNGDVTLMGSEFSQAGTLVRVGVGPQRASWRCIAYSDGTIGEVSYEGSSG